MRRAALFLTTIGCVAGTGEIPFVPDPNADGRVEISPPAIEFPSLILGHEFETTVRLANRTEQTQRVSWYLDPGAFSIEGDGELDLAPGEQKHVIVRFVPQALGIFDDKIEFRCDGGCGDVPLSGAAYDGVDLDNPVGCTEVEMFAEVGSCTRTEMTCTNGAVTDVVITGTQTHAPWEAVKVVSPLPVTIPARRSIVVELEFCPPSQGSWGNCIDYTVSAIDQREYLAHVRISAETPCYCPLEPPSTGIECGGPPEPWVLGPTAVGEDTWFEAYCQAARGEPITRIEVVPPVEGVTLGDVDAFTNRFHVYFSPTEAGRSESWLVLESASASRSIPLVLLAE